VRLEPADFTDMLKKGRVGNLPDVSAHLHFTAAQTRHFAEHAITLYEGIFRRKVSNQHRYPCNSVW
jgi:hypothetical protein